MQPTRNEPVQDRTQYSFGATLAIVTGMVVIVVGLSIVLALFGGLWLDRVLGTKPTVTIVLLVASVPISLYIIYRLTTAATSRMKPTPPFQQGKVPRKFDEGGDDE